MHNRNLLGWILFILFLSCSSADENIENDANDNGDEEQSESIIGNTLPDWQEGYLDIHSINTGRGESTFYIFPDGTTMLVDAAGSLLSSSTEVPPTAAKPNSSVSAGQVIVNYVKHFMKASGNNALDYILLSHFHADHMGSYSTSLPMSSTGNFRMGGITEVGVKIPFYRIIDRGYPDYNYPANNVSSDIMYNYIKFINWAKRTYNATAEQFDVGKSDQIALTHNSSEYNNFQVRNIVASGKVWTGSGTESENTLPPVEEMGDLDAYENVFCIGFHISYGLFDYFAGGDLQYNGKSTYLWRDIETPVANVMTAVEVMKANHHGTASCNGTALLNKLTPQVIVIQPWRDNQPNAGTIGRMYAANSSCKIFTSNLGSSARESLAEYLFRIKSTQGHVVVRVAPRGYSYTVYVLKDTDEKYEVEKIFGPYSSN